MEQFSLEKWLQDKSRKVVTREGKQVRIVCWNLKCNTPIIAAIQWNQEREDCYCYNTIGRCANDIGELDLFFADEEEKLQSIEIPFGAKDSEFISDEFLIPEGCEARIEGNKVIIEKIQKGEKFNEARYKKRGYLTMSREEEIEQASKCVFKSKMGARTAFIRGCEYADRHPRKGLWDAEKVIMWLRANIDNYANYNIKTDECFVDDFEEDLKKAMEAEL